MTSYLPAMTVPEFVVSMRAGCSGVVLVDADSAAEDGDEELAEESPAGATRSAKARRKKEKGEEVAKEAVCKTQEQKDARSARGTKRAINKAADE